DTLHDNSGLEIAGTRPEQNQPALAAGSMQDDRLAGERRKVDDAVQVASNVGESEKPRLRQRHPRDRRYRDDFRRVSEPDKKPLAAACEAEPRRLDLRRGLARETIRELLLAGLQVDAGGAGH